MYERMRSFCDSVRSVGSPSPSRDSGRSSASGGGLAARRGACRRGRGREDALGRAREEMIRGEGDKKAGRRREPGARVDIILCYARRE